MPPKRCRRFYRSMSSLSLKLVVALSAATLFAGCSQAASPTSTQGYKDGYTYGLDNRSPEYALNVTSAAQWANACSIFASQQVVPGGDGVAQWESGCVAGEESRLCASLRNEMATNSYGSLRASARTDLSQDSYCHSG
jgi:hypothetical protein